MDEKQLVQVKIEPTESQFDEELNLKQEYDIEIPPENVTYTNYFEDIKNELPDVPSIKNELEDNDDDDYSDEHVIDHQEHILPDISVEISPTVSKHSKGDGACPKKPSSKPKKNKTKKKKKALKAKPKGKSISNEEKYSEEITQHIEIVTIDEPARQLEHHELFNSRRHMNYTCEPCALGFVVEDAYHMHMKLHSAENGDYECDICQARVKTADVLYRHKLRHYRRYRCIICSLQLRDKDTVAAHVMREHMGTAFICKHCGRDFKRPQYLKRHVEQMHTRPLHLECPVCGRVFHEKGWYRCHVRTHNEEVRRNVERKAICSECGREFRNKAYLIRHLHTHEDRQATTCQHCMRTFKNIVVLKVHMRQHHAKPKLNEDGTIIPNRVGRTYVSAPRDRGSNVNTTCLVCGRVLTTRALLLRHTQRMHTDHTKKFQCDYCKKWYFSKAEVRSHISWSHLLRRRHVCDCGRVFRTPARLRQHACARRPRAPAPPPRDHRCALCGNVYATRQVLNRHMKAHSGETYPCTECGKKFKSQSYVKVHYKIKHLNMTREEIKAQTKRKLIMVENFEEIMNAKIKKNRRKSVEDPLNITVVNVPEVKKEPDFKVPSFETFSDVPREY